jgi:hypothetical protein
VDACEMTIIGLAILLALGHSLTVTCSVLVRPQQWVTPDDILLVCPPGFGWPEKRTSCLRVFRASSPADFFMASWACSLFVGGTLAHMKPSDQDFVSRFVERDKSLQLPDGKAGRVWVGIRRWAHNLPFVFTATNYTINETEYGLRHRGEGNCVYWDLTRTTFSLASCDDDKTVDGFVCQAVLEIYLFCNMTPMERSSCEPRPSWQAIKQDREHCSQTVSKKVAPPSLTPCALNRTCVLHPPKKLTSTLIPDDTDGYCTIYCTEDNVIPRKVACDIIKHQVDEPCACPSEPKMPLPAASCELEDPRQSRSQYRSYTIGISLLTCIVLLVIAGLILWRKFSNSEKQENILDAIALN